MSLLSLYSDPLGRRYKKRSWSTALGITAAKRRVNKAVLGPFRALNPFRQYGNAKKRVLRHLGYNSEIAKAYRKGAWGTYLKRKIIGECGMGNITMPFRESQFTPYGGMYVAPQEEHQTGPLNKGIFNKLSKYAAPGAVVGLALLASKKHNLFQKLTLPAKFKAGVVKVAHQIHGTAKDVWRHGNMAARSAFNDHVMPKLRKYRNELIKKSGAKKVWSHAKNWATRWDESAAPNITMPFRESFQHPYGVHFRNEPQHQQASFAQKVIGLGAVAAGGIGLYKFGKLLTNPVRMAARAERSRITAEHLLQMKKGTPNQFHPMLDLKHGYHDMRANAYDVLGFATGWFRSPKALRKMNKAVKNIRSISMTHDIETMKRQPWLSAKKAKHFQTEIKKHGVTKALKNSLVDLENIHISKTAARMHGKQKKSLLYAYREQNYPDDPKFRQWAETRRLQKVYRGKVRIKKNTAKPHVYSGGSTVNPGAHDHNDFGGGV